MLRVDLFCCFVSPTGYWFGLTKLVIILCFLFKHSWKIVCNTLLYMIFQINRFRSHTANKFLLFPWYVSNSSPFLPLILPCILFYSPHTIACASGREGSLNYSGPKVYINGFSSVVLTTLGTFIKFWMFYSLSAKKFQPPIVIYKRGSIVYYDQG